MKRLFLLGMVLSFAVSLALAQETATPASTTEETAVEETAATEITLTGDVIDNMCAGTKTSAELSEFVKTHTKECALMPNCAETGYSIFADGKLYKFDKDSSAKVEAFLKQADSKLQVVITAKQSGEELSLVNIENQK